jgi:hypothetical protein
MPKNAKVDFFKDLLKRTVQLQDSFAVLPAPNVPLETLPCMIIVYLRGAQLGFRRLQVQLPKAVGSVLHNFTDDLPEVTSTLRRH